MLLTEYSCFQLISDMVVIDSYLQYGVRITEYICHPSIVQVPDLLPPIPLQMRSHSMHYCLGRYVSSTFSPASL